MTLPILKENQFAVGKAKYATGHVLKNDGSFFLTGENINEMYEIFENYEDAKNFVIEKVNENHEIECWIINSKGEHMFTYDQKGERKFKA